MHEADAERLRRGEALGGEEVAPRLPRADRLDHVRARSSPGSARASPPTARTSRPARRSRCRSRRRGRRRRRTPRRARARSSASTAGSSVRSIAASAFASARFSARAVARHLLHPVEVGAGAEAPAVAQQHDGAHGGVARRAPRSACVSSAISVSSNALCTSGRASATSATTLRTSTSSVVVAARAPAAARRRLAGCRLGLRAGASCCGHCVILTSGTRRTSSARSAG